MGNGNLTNLYGMLMKRSHKEEGHFEIRVQLSPIKGIQTFTNSENKLTLLNLIAL